MGSLTGRVAVVTGAGRGIGRAEALHLAAEGAAVLVNDLAASDGGAAAAEETVALIRAAGGKAEVDTHDVSDWEGAAEVIDHAIDSFGDLHIVVNNAGILRDGMSFKISESDWDAVIKVHLKGHFAMSRAAALHWRDKSKTGLPTHGRIINTSSDSGLFANAGQVNYATAKAGIATMTLVLARELERYGVTVNAIAPRARTRLTEGLGFFGEAQEGAFDRFAPERAAPVVAWLASDHAAEVNGQVFIVNGAQLMVVRGYDVAGTVDNDLAPWTVDRLAEASSELFANWPRTTPANATPNW